MIPYSGGFWIPATVRSPFPYIISRRCWCELMQNNPQHRWTRSNFIRDCSELLDVFATWLERKDCKHYFIPNCNLFDQSISDCEVRQIVNRLQQLTDTSTLSQWYMQHYILRAINETDYNGNMTKHLLLTFDYVSIYMIDQYIKRKRTNDVSMINSVVTSLPVAWHWPDALRTLN